MNRAERRRGGQTPNEGGLSRKTLMYVTLGVIVLAALIAIGIASRNARTATAPVAANDLKVGQAAAPFQADTSLGRFDSKAIATPILLEVFATWCPHCQHEVPILNRIAAHYQGKVAVVAVSGHNLGMDGKTPESGADVQAFAQRFGVTYPIAFDPELSVARSYLSSGFPTLVLIDANKKIAGLESGEVAESSLRAMLDKVLRSSKGRPNGRS